MWYAKDDDYVLYLQDLWLYYTYTGGKTDVNSDTRYYMNRALNGFLFLLEH